MKIGIGITTTPRRIDEFSRTFTEHYIYRPNIEFDFTLFSDTDYKGVAHSKNELLKALQRNDHIFLFDDDCYPIADNWWKPYVESGENHLMYQFKLPNKPSSDMTVLYQDDKLISYSHTRGAMIYVTRKVLDTVGGFDEEYGTYFEHPDYTNRIYNAGITTHRAADVVGSEKLLYCLDQDGKIESSIPESVRSKNWIKNYTLYRKNKNSKEYKEFR